MDHDHSNAYQQWLKMGSPATPTTSQQDLLIAASRLDQVQSQDIAVEQQKATITFPLPRQGVALLRFTPR